MDTPVLIAKKLSKTFGKGHTKVQAVNQVSFEILPEEVVLIMGPSGSGKTTLLSMLGGLLRPDSGSVVIDGTDITALKDSQLPEIRALKIGFIFQAFNLLAALTVEENILFPAQLKKTTSQPASVLANKLIELLSLEHRRNALPHTLSGGEKQRVAIARALINEPRLILADEPTGNLDSQNGQEVMMILQEIAKEQACSVIIVTHDPRVEEIADRILWIEDGALRDRRQETHSWARDPVCGMQVDEWKSRLCMEYQGLTYHFCSRRCQEKFNAEPAKYI